MADDFHQRRAGACRHAVDHVRLGTGLKGSIVRKVAVDKTRSSLERVLATLKQKLESQHSQGE